MYYLIKKTLEKTETLQIGKGAPRFVAVLTSEAWLAHREQFDMGIEMDIDLSAIHSTKAEVNYDSLTGTFSVPESVHLARAERRFLSAGMSSDILFTSAGMFHEAIGDLLCSRL